MTLQKTCIHKECSILVLFTLAVLFVPESEAHQLFNSDEERIAGYTIQIVTNPEIPGPGSPSKLLVGITDRDGKDVFDVRAGLKIFKDDVLLHELPPGIYKSGHIDMDYVFPESGLYIVEVTIIGPLGKEITAKFNIGILQTFGYIFYSLILFAIIFPAGVFGAVYFMRRQKNKSKV